MSILSEIKKLVFNSEEEVSNFRDAKVGDLIVRVDADDFAVGLPLLLVTEDGVIPASPDLAGEHVLDDGRTIVLDEAGIITEVRDAVGAEEEDLVNEEDFVKEAKEDVEKVELKEEKEEMKEEEKEEEMREHDEEKKKYEVLEKRIEEMESIIKEMMDVNKKTSDFSNVILEKLENFTKDTPAEMEFKSIKSEYKNAVADSSNKKMTHLESIRNLRKK